MEGLGHVLEGSRTRPGRVWDTSWKGLGHVVERSRTSPEGSGTRPGRGSDTSRKGPRPGRARPGRVSDTSRMPEGPPKGLGHVSEESWKELGHVLEVLAFVSDNVHSAHFQFI